MYNEKEQQLYMETDVSGVGLGAVQVRDVMWFSRNEAHDNAALWPISITSKSLTSIDL